MTNKVITWLAATVAVLFGILTIKSGGQVLFGDESYRLAAGNYVPFVLWFNFTAGFIYMIAGIGIALRKPWAAGVALLIAISTLLVFAAFGLYIFAEGAYEMRTVAAMTLRSTIWTVIFVLTYRQLIRRWDIQ
ncbi:hypothetical protein Ga0123461_1989 [Mariprofundus aestuarium]|uniref:Uncharacterized protein n=1 Tax=Mariprofundus aestuarium TaxID=1921086 RepID=A0A2K8KZG0_MARES|nr:hypothetical protein [Mariprofundus aestuarium]ATX80395.1 hypothetical protein Ga0123461_1989 [Mariprofundus aestuarium]